MINLGKLFFWRTVYFYALKVSVCFPPPRLLINSYNGKSKVLLWRNQTTICSGDPNDCHQFEQMWLQCDTGENQISLHCVQAKDALPVWPKPNNIQIPNAYLIFINNQRLCVKSVSSKIKGIVLFHIKGSQISRTPGAVLGFLLGWRKKMYVIRSAQKNKMVRRIDTNRMSIIILI